MNYIDFIADKYIKSFKVNHSIEFLRPNGQAVKIETFNIGKNYYRRIFKDCLGLWQPESEHLVSNTADKDYLRKSTVANIYYLGGE